MTIWNKFPKPTAATLTQQLCFSYAKSSESKLSPRTHRSKNILSHSLIGGCVRFPGFHTNQMCTHMRVLFTGVHIPNGLQSNWNNTLKSYTCSVLFQLGPCARCVAIIKMSNTFDCVFYEWTICLTQSRAMLLLLSLDSPSCYKLHFRN